MSVAKPLSRDLSVSSAAGLAVSGVNAAGHALAFSGPVSVGSGGIALGGGSLAFSESVETRGDVGLGDGGTMSVAGDLVQSAANIDVGSGELDVAGDYRVQSRWTNSAGEPAYGDMRGYLYMRDPAATVRVGGDFYFQAYSVNYTHYGDGQLAAGTLYVGGDFSDLSGAFRPGSSASSAHRVVLTGDGYRSVTFTSSSAKFNILQLMQGREMYLFNPDNCWNTLVGPDYVDPRTLPRVTGVVMMPKSATVAPGGEQEFSAGVFGVNGVTQRLAWLVEGAKSEGTAVSDSGVLTVAEDEPNGTFTVVAASVDDPSKTARAEVTVVTGKPDDPEPPDEPVVEPISVKAATIAGLPASVTYTGSNIAPDFTVSVDGKQLAAWEDYLVLFSNNVSAGKATVAVFGIGDYTGWTYANFQIEPADIKLAALSLPESVEYAGEPATPSPTLTFNDASLVEGRDYELAYEGNEAPGTATLKVTGIGNFTGLATQSFEIEEAVPVDNRIASGTSGTCAWQIDADGKLTIAPADGVSGMLESTEYIGSESGSTAPWFDYREKVVSVSVARGVKAGESCEGMFFGCTALTACDLSGLDTSGTKNISSMFRHCTSLSSLPSLAIDTSKATDMSSMFFDCTSLEVLDVSGFDTSQVASMDFMFAFCESLAALDLSGFNTANAGSIAGMFLDCARLETLDLSSFDTSSVSGSGLGGKYGVFRECAHLKTIYVSDAWDLGRAQASAYMFFGSPSLVGGNGTAYSSDHIDSSYARVDKAGAPGYLTYKKGAGAVGSLKTSITGATVGGLGAKTYTGASLAPEPTVTLGGAPLKKGADYTVTFKNAKGTATVKATNVKAADTYRVVIEGRGGYEGSVTKAFKINPAPASKFSVGKIADKTYSGSAFKPAPAVQFNKMALKKGADYTLSYKNNVKAGTATVTVKGKGNFTGSKNVTFKIAKASAKKLAVAKVANQKYTGKAIKPAPAVKFNGKKLKKGADYTLSYKNNKNAGTATITVKGKGNFTGTKAVKFKIVKPTKAAKVRAAAMRL